MKNYPDIGNKIIRAGLGGGGGVVKKKRAIEEIFLSLLVLQISQPIRSLRLMECLHFAFGWRHFIQNLQIAAFDVCKMLCWN